MSVPAASLYPFGMEGGDRECVQRMVDFNSSLFKPEIGFPFGKSLRDALYVSSPPRRARKRFAISFLKNPHEDGAETEFHLNVHVLQFKMAGFCSPMEDKSHPRHHLGCQQITSYFG